MCGRFTRNYTWSEEHDFLGFLGAPRNSWPCADTTGPKHLRKRVRLRKIKEAEEAIVACEGAISRAADEVGRAIFTRSKRIWQRQLDALRPALTVLATRTKVIGTGNSFEVLIPLDEIDPAGQTYRVIRSDLGNREFVPFHLGIEPYVSEINRMPQGFERYDRYLAHEKAAKALELHILQHAVPESHLADLPFLWDRNYLADKQVTICVDRRGTLITPTVSQIRPEHPICSRPQPT